MPRVNRNMVVLTAKLDPDTMEALRVFAGGLPHTGPNPITVGAAARMLIEKFFEDTDETAAGVHGELEDKGYQEGVRQGLRAVHERLKHPENW